MDLEVFYIIKQLSVSFWVIFLVFWLINYFCLNPNFVKSVHFIWTFVLIFKTLSSSFTCLMSVVDKDSVITQYFSLGFSSSSTLCHTLLSTVLLLMSKGLNLTRESLEKKDVHNISLIIGMNYLSFSLYSIDKDNLNMLLVIILLVSWVLAHKSTLSTIKLLKNRYFIMRRNNIPHMASITSAKLRMMSCFKISVNSFYFPSVLLNTVFISAGWFGLKIEKNTQALIEGFYELIYCLNLAFICLVFLPRNRGMFFYLENTQEEIEVIPMYEAPLSTKKETIEPDKPFILVSPSQDTVKEAPYQSLYIALPIKLRLSKNEGLTEPLLRSQLS